MLPVWMEGTRDFLDVLGPASDDDISESLHFWVADEGLLESLLAGWHYVAMVDSDIQWRDGAWPGTELRELVWCDHFLVWAVMDCEVISLQV